MNRALELANIKAKVHAKDFARAPDPVGKWQKIVNLPFDRMGQCAIPAYVIAEFLLSLPPDTEVLRVADDVYGDCVVLVLQSKDFPKRETARGLPQERWELEIEWQETSENSRVALIRGLRKWEPN